LTANGKFALVSGAERSILGAVSAAAIASCGVRARVPVAGGPGSFRRRRRPRPRWSRPELGRSAWGPSATRRNA